MVFQNLPEKLVDRLMPFQKEGVKFAVGKHGRCLIADEMGLGKTLQAISVAYYYKNEWPLLIIVPSSLRYSWIEEFEKWLPDINPGDINLVQSGTDVSDIGASQVTITTFGLLSKGTSRILREALMNQGFHVVIVDESHYIRNSKTVSAKTVVPLIKNANRRILLSGTPALARPVELYPQIDAICPDEFGTWWTYTARYCDARLEWIGKVKRRNVNGASNLEELQQKLSDKLMIRREKSQVLTQLPPKQRQRVLFELKDSDLKKEIRQTFDELRPLMKRSNQDNFEVLTGGGEHDAKDTNMLSLIQRLYKLSGTAKIGPAKEYIEMLCDNPKLKFLVFAYHHDMMNGLSESLHDKKIRFIRIDGETPPSERPHLVHQFQSDPDTRVAVLSILAAGVGLTFTAATLVVFAEMYWTPGTMVQCEDRAHRIGQTSCVAVHYLVAKDTMDEWVWSAVCKKTIVTSTTLTGKKRKMEALEGDRYQVDVLSNAEVWVPASNNETSNLTEYFETTLDSSQKSILQFFSPKHMAMKRKLKEASENKENKAIRANMNESDTVHIEEDGESPEEASVDRACHTPASKRQRTDASLHSNSAEKPVTKKYSEDGNHIIVLDSDGEDDFVDSKTKDKSKKKSSSSSKKQKSKKVKHSSISPKYSLHAVFEKVRNREVLNGSIDVSEDNEHTPVKDSRGSTKTENERKADKGDASVGTKNCGLDRNEWSCIQCTYLNHKDLIYCEMCETPKKFKAVSKSHPRNSVKDNPLKQVTEARKNLPKPMNKQETAGEDEHIIDSEFDSQTSSGSQKTENTRDEEDSTHYIDDTIDFDPGSDHEETTAELSESVDVETDNVADDYSIDEYGSPDSEAVNEVQEEIEQPGALDENQIVDEDSLESASNKEFTKDIVGIVNMDDRNNKGLDREVVEEDSQSINGNSDSSHSKYFDRTKSTYAVSNPLNRKEIVIENKLKLNESLDQKNLHEDKCAKNMCNIDTTKILKDQDATPTSGKKYRFKSVRKSKDVQSSPGVSSPSGHHVETVKSRENNIARKRDIDTWKSKGEYENMDIATVQNCDSEKLDTVQTEHLKDTVVDGEHTPKNGHRSNDYSFSSPELDQMLANETEQCSADVSNPAADEKRVVDLDSVPVYSLFKYQCSKYTDRIYLLTKDDEAFNLNFIPSDVQFGNDDGLPDILLHPDNLRLVQRFVREWLSLTETKRRLIVKSGQPFISPIQQYEKLRSCKTVNTQRHKTKVETNLAAHQKAKDINGSVRIVSKHSGVHSENSGEGGVTQAVSEDGTPLCLQCFQPYTNHLVTKSTIQDENNAWNTRFCSRKCSQEYWMVSNNDYIRDRVFEAEHGICQLCKFDAHSLFRQIRDTGDQRKRAEVITRSKFNTMTVKVKEQMVRKPAAGQFWHVDHIIPVWEGGGQCDIDNLRTLCVICHQKVTAKQAAKRATVRKLGTAVNSGDITAFFQRN